MGHSAKCRERIEDLMRSDPVFKDRVDRADERINENVARYLEKHDKDKRNIGAEEEGPATKRNRTDGATGSQDPYVQEPGDGDAEMGVPEATTEDAKQVQQQPSQRP